jgi:tetratricopeptide (TPR) repeat protein
VTPSLVRASDATQIWANPYDQTIAEVFQVQADIAKRVAEALNVALLEPEQKVLEGKPTKIAEAYDFYLRGMDYFTRTAENKNDSALSIDLFEKAIALDPYFTQAYARLAQAYANSYWMHFDHTKERIAKSKRAIDKALELGPDLLDTHISLGAFYYFCMLDYERALEQFEIALKKQPGNSEILEYVGVVKRRQGKLNDTIVYLKKAFEINPRSAPLALYLGQTYALLRNYAEAEHFYDKAISLSPDYDPSYFWKARLHLSWTGNFAKANEVIKGATQKIASLDVNQIPYLWILVGIFEGDYQKDLVRLSSISEEGFDTQFYFVPKDQLYAQIHGLMNNKEKEKEYYNSAQNYLKNKIKEQPDDSRLHSALGIACAGLGLREKSIQEAIKATELLPISKEFWRGPYRVKDLAQVYVMVGEYNKAIDKIEYLLSIPGELSITLLKIDPVWAPLQSLPRFQALLNKTGLNE